MSSGNWSSVFRLSFLGLGRNFSTLLVKNLFFQLLIDKQGELVGSFFPPVFFDIAGIATVTSSEGGSELPVQRVRQTSLESQMHLQRLHVFDSSTPCLAERTEIIWTTAPQAATALDLGSNCPSFLHHQQRHSLRPVGPTVVPLAFAF